MLNLPNILRKNEFWSLEKWVQFVGLAKTTDGDNSDDLWNDIEVVAALVLSTSY